MAAYWYLHGLFKVQDRTIDWASDTIKAILLSPSYTFDRTHQFVSSVVANELTGYTRPTVTVSGPTKDVTDDAIYFGASDTLIATVAEGQSLKSMALYRQVTNDSDHILLGWYDRATNLATNGGGVNLDFDANGALSILRVAP